LDQPKAHEPETSGQNQQRQPIVVTSSSQQTRQQPGRKAPISSHPAFPVIVSLWFAALLGIGSLIVPAALLERLVAVTGLSAILSSAEPPLGDTARTIIALIGAGVGAVSGLLIAHKVTGAHAPSGPAAVHEVKVPISAMEELGALSFDQAVDEDPSLEPKATSPVNKRLRALIAPDETTHGDLSESPPPQVAPEETPIETAEETLKESDNAAEIPAEPASHHTLTAGPVAGMTTQQLVAEPLNQLGIVQLVERFALSLQHNAPATAKQPPEAEMAESKNAPAEVINQPSSPILPLPDAMRPIEYDFDPGTLGNQDASESVGENEDIDYLPAMDVKAMLAKQDQAPKDTSQDENTAQNDGVDNDDSDAGGDYSSLLGMKKSPDRQNDSAELVTVFTGQDERRGDQANDRADIAYQSGSFARRRFDPPALVSAAKAPIVAEINPAATERALRDALEKLQKMSGVG
jgi:hypothetical protein